MFSQIVCTGTVIILNRTYDWLYNNLLRRVLKKHSNHNQVVFCHLNIILYVSFSPTIVSVVLHPSTGDDEHKRFVCLTLVIHLPPKVLYVLIAHTVDALVSGHLREMKKVSITGAGHLREWFSDISGH